MMYMKAWLCVCVTLMIGYINNQNHTNSIRYENFQIEFINIITFLICIYICLKTIFSKNDYTGNYKIFEILLSIGIIIVLIIPLDMQHNKYILSVVLMIISIISSSLIHRLINQPKTLIKPIFWICVLVAIAYFGNHIPR